MYNRKVIHTGRLFQVEQVSAQMGKRVFEDLKQAGRIEPELTPSGREFITPTEAAIFSEALRAR